VCVCVCVCVCVFVFCGVYVIVNYVQYLVSHSNAFMECLYGRKIKLTYVFA